MKEAVRSTHLCYVIDMWLSLLQSRTVVVENLPEDYSRQNLEKMFSVVGRSNACVFIPIDCANRKRKELHNS